MKYVMRMKKILFSLLLCAISCVTGLAEPQLNIVGPTYSTVESFSGIEVSTVIPQADGSYEVTLYNSNRDGYSYSEIITYSFEWYLSYKGKRCSDYYKSAIREGKKASKKVFAWPGVVPSGNERYVTVQLGREPKARDYRD